MPRGIPSVLAALARVRKTSKLTGREKPTYKGVKPEHAYYVLPEAAMIALLKDEMTRAVYIVNICRLQPLLEYRVEAVHHPGKNTPGLQAQKWRDVLGMSMNHKSTTRSEKRRTELMELFEKSSVASGLPPGTTDLRKLNLMTAQWVDICREVLWVMSEASWRFELVCLDYWLFKHPRNVPHAPSKRRGEVLQSIPHFGFSMWPDGIEDRGFASEDLDERFEAVYGLTRVMQGWTRACKLPVATTEKAYDMLMNREKRKVLEQEPYLIENEVKELEGIVIEHYITSFIHVFQRVPSLPRAVSSPQMPVAA
ncbi:hypothetical protein CYLTODRAFT_267344 [Cylindrobasidium torrendii FP15055 ss-10]|uniref:Uncharacterized protein n=1 Tax=Cylindrobasidium torrendii FP15055 ss-10 TaxID=1314674 RepID=A0A0D7ARK4_9AGAR|nr:hypothetical protein CYLTODRAFT_267344 [Cylindrobasidium torrendii FP15055 ss-10]